MRGGGALWAIGLGAVLALGAMEGRAEACGGCFNPPENPTVVTDHRMILSVSKDQSTLYDQIRYQGSPASFGWVLPISGEVTIGLSADIVFSTLDSMTQTQVIGPPRNCPPPPDSCRGRFSAAGAEDAASNGGVNVIRREVVGPYETVQLAASDPGALKKWLTDNGFSVPPDVAPVIDTYVAEHFNFLALKLVPGKSVQDMRPVRVTTKGANVALPLRMIAAGTGPEVGISLWVVGEGRYEPQNFPTFVIAEGDLVWDWAASKSNYTDLRAQKTSEGNGRAWEVESSIAVFRQQVEQIVRQGSYGGGPVPQTPEDRAAQDYLPIEDGQGTVTKTASEVREDDLTTLFAGIPDGASRVTRLRADLAHAALNQDLVMHAATDQATLSNLRRVTRELGQPQCPVFSGCEQVGTAPRDQVTVGPSEDDDSFTCATTAHRGNGWMSIGLGFAALSAVHAVRRRRARR